MTERKNQSYLIVAIVGIIAVVAMFGMVYAGSAANSVASPSEENLAGAALKTSLLSADAMDKELAMSKAKSLTDGNLREIQCEDNCCSTGLCARCWVGECWFHYCGDGGYGGC